jgi:hypothetical protein
VSSPRIPKVTSKRKQKRKKYPVLHRVKGFNSPFFAPASIVKVRSVRKVRE